MPDSAPDDLPNLEEITEDLTRQQKFRRKLHDTLDTIIDTTQTVWKGYIIPKMYFWRADYLNPVTWTNKGLRRLHTSRRKRYVAQRTAYQQEIEIRLRDKGTHPRIAKFLSKVIPIDTPELRHIRGGIMGALLGGYPERYVDIACSAARADKNTFVKASIYAEYGTNLWGVGEVKVLTFATNYVSKFITGQDLIPEGTEDTIIVTYFAAKYLNTIIRNIIYHKTKKYTRTHMLYITPTTAGPMTALTIADWIASGITKYKNYRNDRADKINGKIET